ncbi:hypothetical protein HK101_008528 [Irineochytrium annulatum]|nr:hypothetical protein HK101_008528 [Irineochytrium annulatum]
MSNNQQSSGPNTTSNPATSDRMSTSPRASPQLYPTGNLPPLPSLLPLDTKSSKAADRMSLSSVGSTHSPVRVSGAELPNPDPGEAADSARNSVVDVPPKLTIIDRKSYKVMPWKNGLGETSEIAIHPEKVNYHKEDFDWRLSISEVKDSCSFSLFNGYDIALTLLPEEGASLMMRGTMSAPAVLHHNDQEHSVPIRPLIPYTFAGEVTVNLETICPHGLNDDGICDGDGDANTPMPSPHMPHQQTHPHGTPTLQGEKAAPKLGSSSPQKSSATVAPTRKILLGTFTIVYVVSGTIHVTVDSDAGTVHTVGAGNTLICERHNEAAPTDFTMRPLVKKHPKGLHLTDNQDATVVIIQVHMKPQMQRNSLGDSSTNLAGPISPQSATSQHPPPLRPPRGRTGSIIIYDDQPLWNLPREMDSQVSLEGSIGALAAAAGATGTLPVKFWESAKHYRAPTFSARYQGESEVPPPVVRDSLVIEEFPEGKISTAWINMVKQGLSEWLRIPVIVARGVKAGPVVGITAVVHGNELNGVPCIHRVITDIDVHRLNGTVVAVPCVNVPGYLRFSREFSDGKDLNRVFPGSESGTASQVYAYNLLHKIINHFDYMIDLHTASFGRVNSYYVRSDLNDPVSATLAKLQQPQIILHNSGQDGTLRSAAMSRGIKAITVEIGNPQLFQNSYVQWSYMGVMRILAYLNMFSTPYFFEASPTDSDGGDADTDSMGQPKGPPSAASEARASVAYAPPPNTIICSKGFWIYTKTGGVLEVYPAVNTVVRKGDLIARIKNIFGNIVDEIYSPSHGVTIGRSSNPVAMAGDRVLHLGIIKKENEVLPKEAKENY